MWGKDGGQSCRMRGRGRVKLDPTDAANRSHGALNRGRGGGGEGDEKGVEGEGEGDE